MKAEKIAEKLSLTLVAGGGGTDKEVTGCHIGDLLSLVMSRAEAGDAWITIQGNINVAAVASLNDISMVIIAEGISPDESLLKRAEAEAIPIYTSEKSAYALALEISDCL